MIDSAAAAISLSHLSKNYGALAAVRDVSLDVMPGEVFGFLGLNGAGKTTTIRILLDLLRPSGGSAALFGIDCQRESRRTRALVGYLPGELGLYSDMTGQELLDLMGRLSASTIDILYQHKLIDRLELARDDLEGLDPLMQRALHEILFELRRRGRTVFMSSHVLSEVERVCDRIAVIRKGEIVLLSSVDEARRLSGRTVRVHFTRDVDAITLPVGMSFIERKPNEWTLRVAGEVGELIPLLAALPVRDLEIVEPALEDVLGSFYRE